MPNPIQQAQSDIRQFSLVPWELIPDLGLYMDQVITFITRAYEPLYGEDAQTYLSPSMINNYVKSKLIPRPVGKKYSRDQIALLTMVVALKQVSSMQDIHRMLVLKEGETVEALYNSFSERFAHVIHVIRSSNTDVFGPLSTALDFAILSSGFNAGCALALKAESAVETDGDEA